MACYFPFYKDGQPQPCGKCAYCLQRRVNNWVFRCMQHMKVSKSAYFVTLTYDVPPLTDTGQMTLRKPDLQKFFKRLRKRKGCGKDYPIRYYVCGEYGDTYYRPHYHAIIFNSTYDDIVDAWVGFTDLGDPEGVVLGHVHFDVVNETTIAYCAKYMNKGKKIPMFFDDLRLP